MSSCERIDVIPFESPYIDPESIERIQANIEDMAYNKLPIFQLDVGPDIHLAGTMAVRHVIEQAYDKLTGDAYQKAGFPRFAFWHQNMRLPYLVLPSHAVAGRIAPHMDSGQVGPAIHKEYPGEPTKVQGGYKKEGVTLPSIAVQHS